MKRIIIIAGILFTASVLYAQKHEIRAALGEAALTSALWLENGVSVFISLFLA